MYKGYMKYKIIKVLKKEISLLVSIYIIYIKNINNFNKRIGIKK